MDAIEVGKLDELMAKHAELKAAVDSFGVTLNEIQAYANETNVIVKDILLGTNIADWIADLAASGTSSATYANSERMNALIKSTDACRNVNVAQYLLDWAVEQNKANTYFSSAIGDLSGVTWESLTSVDAIMANRAVFTAIANDNTIFSAVMGNSVCRPSVFTQWTVTESIIRASSTALAVLNTRKTSQLEGSAYGYSVSFSFDGGKAFVLSADRGESVSVTRPNDTSASSDNISSVNYFAKNASVSFGYSGVYATLFYVDFS